jgi:hypothetical protein
LTTCYRWSDYRTPLRSIGSTGARPARFHRGNETEPTQYLALHPLGPHAELIRSHSLRTLAQLRAIEARTWALQVDLDDLIVIGFDTAADFGLSAEQLVDDDYSACHQLADDLRAANAAGMIVPSAALPGTSNAVIFGARVAAPYLTVPLSSIDIPASVTGEKGRPLESLLGQVRMIGDPHPALEAWTNDDTFRFVEPDFELVR